MEQEKWNKLRTEMAIEVIARDLCNVMVPYKEGILRAKETLEQGNKRALDVEYQMGQALNALQVLGYIVIPNDAKNDGRKDVWGF
jgi:hypothetical protein